MTSTGPISSYNQGTTYALRPNVGIQIPIGPNGITMISESGSPITLGTDEGFSNPTVTLPSAASLPWPSGGVLFARSTVAATMIVIQGMANYYNPAVFPSPPVAPLLIDTFVNNQNTQNFTITPTIANIRTLFVIAACAVNQSVFLTLRGNQSGLDYTTFLSYDRYGIGNYNYGWKISVDPTLDTSYQLTVQQSGALVTNSLYVYEDLQIATTRIEATPGIPVNTTPIGSNLCAFVNLPNNTSIAVIPATPTDGRYQLRLSSACINLSPSVTVYLIDQNTSSVIATWLPGTLQGTIDLKDVAVYGAVVFETIGTQAGGTGYVWYSTIRTPSYN